MLNKTSRRSFILGSAALMTLGLRPSGAAAMTENSAIKLINTVVTEINKVIDSGKSETAMIRDFETIFVRYSDVPIMAQYVLGADGRRASAAQKKAFSKAFQGYISRKYGKRFREFIGGRIEVQSARQIKAGYEIKTMAFLKGESPFEVTFLVSDKSGRDLFFNLFIEGVNLLLTERTEIGAMLDRRGGNIDALIRDMAQAG